MTKKEKQQVAEICRILNETYGTDYKCYLNHENAWQLLIATMLSAQCTDARVNIVTKDLFVKYPTLQAFADADIKELDFSDDVYASRRIIHELYQNYDRVQLLLTKSQGSSLAGCIDEFVAFTEKNYRMLADAQAKVCGVSAPDDYTIHWMAHMQIDAFVHLLTHEPDEEKAVAHLGDILKYLLAGWYALFQKDE